MRPHTNRTTRRPAVTLVELMIVVVVLGIVAALAAPLLAETDVTRVNEAAKLLVADLQFAQMYAINHGNEISGLRVESGGTAYSVVTDASPPFTCGSATAVTDEINDAPYVTTFGTGRVAELTGVTVSAYSLDGDACVVFDTFGALDQTSDASITLSAGGNTVTVTIDAATGEPSIAP